VVDIEAEKSSMESIALVLLPGLDGTGHLFESLLEALPPQIEPIVVSYSPLVFLNYYELRDAVLPHLPVDRPYVILGESFGGPLALLLAAAHPPGLVGVILSATFLSNPTILPSSLGSMVLNASAFRVNPPAAIVRWFLVGVRAPSLLVHTVQNVLSSCNPYVMSSRVRCLQQTDVGDALRACTLPLLYMQATNDRLVRQDSLDAMLAIRPDIEIERIDAPHFLLQREPERGAEAIVRFIARRFHGVRRG
jgi:pimeloyl-ACP methyl ester carboxylesterase